MHHLVYVRVTQVLIWYKTSPNTLCPIIVQKMDLNIPWSYIILRKAPSVYYLIIYNHMSNPSLLDTTQSSNVGLVATRQ
jgi:hypothetical protein